MSPQARNISFVKMDAVESEAIYNGMFDLSVNNWPIFQSPPKRRHLVIYSSSSVKN